MKLKNLLLPRHQLLYIAIFLCLIILTINRLIYVLLMIVYIIYILKNHRNIVLYCLVISIIYFGSLLVFNFQSIESGAQLTFKVRNAAIKEGKTYIVGVTNGKVVKIVLSAPMEVRPGESYMATGDLIVPTANTIPNTFNYKNYLLSKKIKQILYTNSLSHHSDSFSLNIIPYEINKYIEKNIPLSKSYVKTFILADKSDIDQDVIESINILGISHLFAVSGLHVGLLVIAITYIFSKMNISDKTIKLFICILLITYMIITGFAASITRASSMYMLILINNRFKLHLSSIDLLSVLFVVFLIINPYIYYNVGFVLSFLVTLSILISGKLLKRHNSIQQLFLVGYTSFIITFPIIINLNKSINLYTVFINILFILYMSYIVLPLSYLVFVFPFIDRLLYGIISLYNIIIINLSRHDYFIIHGSFTFGLQIMIIYFFIIFYFSLLDREKGTKRVLVILLILVTLFLNGSIFSLSQRVIFLDVKGDATLITDSFNKCNILIDTGEKDEYNSLVSYIHSRNIKRIDYMIVSHFHSDHFGELDDILDEFQIKNVVTPTNAELYSNEMIRCGEINIFIYGLSNKADNPNNNSLFVSVFLSGKHYLFTGDSEKVREKEFVDNYNIDIDYLKVAHHGSRTSSTDIFLQSVKPEEAFIIVRRNNIHKHPNQIIIDRLKHHDISIYRTDILGSIEVKYFFGYETKKYYMP